MTLVPAVRKLSSTTSSGSVPSAIVGAGGVGVCGIKPVGKLTWNPGSSSWGAKSLVGTSGRGSTVNGLKFAPLACALFCPNESPAAGRTAEAAEGSLMIGKALANSATVKSRPGATSMVRLPS